MLDVLCITPLTAAAAVVRLIATERSLQDNVMSQVSGVVADPVQTIDPVAVGKRCPKAAAQVFTSS
jgi:hypothetical protein